MQQNKPGSPTRQMCGYTENANHRNSIHLWTSVTSLLTEKSSTEFISELEDQGILLEDDLRLAEVKAQMIEWDALRKNKIMTKEHINALMKMTPLLHQAISQNLVIPNFAKFTEELKKIYEEVSVITGGKVADYIPELAKANPKSFGISICTVDGQRWSIGDTEEPVCIQSCSKPISYLIALKEHGFEKVHKHMGHEPSGVSFNSLVLKDVEGTNRRIPHNPMINSGAIMSHALIKADQPMSERFSHVMAVYKQLCGTKVTFSNPCYLSERDTADLNFCLGYMMSEYHAFPEDTELNNTLQFYFQSCSIEITNRQLAILASTLANGGTNPLTYDAVFDADHVKDCLSLMLSTGLYDFSGEWAFSVGLPGKSGVAGLIYIVVPNVLGIAIWSPPLDGNGNSIKGIKVAQRLINKFNFHMFDGLRGAHNIHKKANPLTGTRDERRLNAVMSLFYAADGNLREIKQLHENGFNILHKDYDGRSALHLACCEGNYEIAEFLIEVMIEKRQVEDAFFKDRFGRTPLQDAKENGHAKIEKLFLKLNRPATPTKKYKHLPSLPTSTKSLEVPANVPDANGAVITPKHSSIVQQALDLPKLE